MVTILTNTNYGDYTYKYGDYTYKKIILASFLMEASIKIVRLSNPQQEVGL